MLRRAALATLLLAAALPLTAAEQGSFTVRLVVLDPVDVHALPASVQRLEKSFPGYGSRWAHARAQLPHAPIRAIELHREAQRPVLDAVGFSEWERDVEEARRALFLGWRPGAGE